MFIANRATNVVIAHRGGGADPFAGLDPSPTFTTMCVSVSGPCRGSRLPRAGGLTPRRCTCPGVSGLDAPGEGRERGTERDGGEPQADRTPSRKTGPMHHGMPRYSHDYEEARRCIGPRNDLARSDNARSRRARRGDVPRPPPGFGLDRHRPSEGTWHWNCCRTLGQKRA